MTQSSFGAKPAAAESSSAGAAKLGRSGQPRTEGRAAAGRPPTSSSGIPIPKEHGAWAVLYAPLASAILIAQPLNWTLAWFFLVVTGLFLAHEPLARLARAGWPWQGLGGRAQSWWRWAALYLVLVAGAGSVLWLGYGLDDLPVLGVATLFLLAIHLYRVGRRDERTVAGEVVGIAGLTLTLPGALHVVSGGWSPDALWLWLFHFVYFAGGIFYVKARVSSFVGRPDSGTWVLTSDLYHILAVLAIGLGGTAGWYPPWVAVAFLPPLARALWATRLTPEKLVMKRIGYSEVGFTVLFVVLIVLAWRV